MGGIWVNFNEFDAISTCFDTFLIILTLLGTFACSKFQKRVFFGEKKICRLRASRKAFKIQYTHIYIYIHICTYIYLTWARAGRPGPCKVYVCTYMHVYVYMYICVYAYTNICVYVSILISDDVAELIRRCGWNIPDDMVINPTM